jgi:uncharacterized protein YoxC
MNAGAFRALCIDLRQPPCHTRFPMTPLAVGVIVACVVALTIVLISTLLSLRKTALRAESVLAQVEREIRPMASELEGVTGELQKLSRNANDNLQRIGSIVDRVEDISVQAARVAGAVGSLTRIGQYAGLAAGVKRGVEVFLHRLKDRHY